GKGSPHLKAYGDPQYLAGVGRNLQIGLVNATRLEMLGMRFKSDDRLLWPAYILGRQTQPWSVTVHPRVDPLPGARPQRELPRDHFSRHTALGNRVSAELDRGRLGEAHAFEKLLYRCHSMSCWVGHRIGPAVGFEPARDFAALE